MAAVPSPSRVGIALGSGSARGLAHIGVLQALTELGVQPHIVCGSSIGALIGAVHCSGHLPELADWVGQLTTRGVLRYMQIQWLPQGGVAAAGPLIEYLRELCGDITIEELPTAFAAVATDLYRGRETWLQRGQLWEAVRASIAIPGILTPVHLNGRWLVDGGLVNPVPVSLCRALGADHIIAVNLNTAMVGRHDPTTRTQALTEPDPAELDEENRVALVEEAEAVEESLFQRLGMRRWQRPESGREPKIAVPGTFHVMATAINVMQDRITRSRLAGEPPDVVIAPRLSHIGLLEFNRGTEAIAAGYDSVMRLREVILHALERQ